jgi:hypothetical protein
VQRHELDVTSLIFGLVFLGTAGVYALLRWDLITFSVAAVLGPALLVLVGAAGLWSTVRRSPPQVLGD